MKITSEVFGLLALLVGTAVVAMLVARPQVIRDVFGGFSDALGVAISPLQYAESVAPSLSPHTLRKRN